jgi:glycosyltransferase involved in cell wall biosynthesis
LHGLAAPVNLHALVNRPQISVAICTHNPRADYLARTLAGLRAQTLPHTEWELLLVDNASRPPVETDLSWHPHARRVSEPALGLTNARLRSIAETATDLLIFVDDDNVLAPDYLAVARELAAQWPILGAWGGHIEPEFESPPPDWTRPYWQALAIRPVERDRWSNVKGEPLAEPYGAGLCVRRSVARAYLESLQADPRRRALDRTGTQLTSGGDTDFVHRASDLGLGTGLFAKLRVTHLIPAARTEESYLLRLVEALSYSKTLLDALRGIRPVQPSRSQRLFDFYRHLHISLRERRFLAARARGRARALSEISSQTTVA